MAQLSKEGDTTAVNLSSTIWDKPYTTSSPVERRRSALNAAAIRAELKGNPDAAMEAYTRLAEFDLKHGTGENTPCDGTIQRASSLSS